MWAVRAHEDGYSDKAELLLRKKERDAALATRYEASLEEWRNEPQPKRENHGRVKVYLNVYTLPGIGGSISGVYHSGIEIMFQEYYFAKRTDLKTGVCRCSPRAAPGWKFKQRIELGEANLSLTGIDLHATLHRLKSSWRGKDYDLARRNCNHFSNEVSNILLKKAASERSVETCAGLDANLVRTVHRTSRHG